MRGTHWRGWLLGAVTVGGVAAACWFPPLPQDPTYYVFADRRTFFGIPNIWNVCSNLAFVLVGAFGLRPFSRLRLSSSRTAYVVFCLGVGGRLRFGVLPLRALNADAGLGSVTDDGRFYGAFRDGGPRPHLSIMRPGPAVAVGPRGSHLGRVLALVRVPRPRRSPGVRGHRVPADAPDAVDAHPLQRHRPAYPMAVGHLGDLRRGQSGGAL